MKGKGGRPAAEVDIGWIKQLARDGAHLLAICEATGLSKFQVNRIARRERIAVPRKPYMHQEPIPPAYDPDEARRLELTALMQPRKPDPLAVAQVAVPGFSRDAMTRHGRVIRNDDVIRLANHELKRLGIRQLDANPSWCI